MTPVNPSDSPFFAIPPDRLACAIRNIAAMVQNTREHRRVVLWSVVGHAFGHGSTVSRALCVHAGLDPDRRLPL